MNVTMLKYVLKYAVKTFNYEYEKKYNNITIFYFKLVQINKFFLLVD